MVWKITVNISQTLSKSNGDKEYTFFFYIRNLVAKAPGLNLGKDLSNLLSNNEALN